MDFDRESKTNFKFRLNLLNYFIMGNMSYCRFENTYQDLQDCLEALDNEGGITGVEEDANDYEKPYVRRLVKLCREIVDNYEDELDE